MKRRMVRTLLAVAVGGVLFTATMGLHARAQQPGPMVATTRVLIYDNGGSFMPGDPATGQWGFMPGHLQVTKGAMIEFVNPAGNARPHTITSITTMGMPPMRTLIHGAAFDSSPTLDQRVMPGTSFVLDTSTLDAGQYLYYCWIHPWMAGSITVMPAP